MKFILSILVLGAALPSFAVETKKCPDYVQVTYESVRVLIGKELAMAAKNAGFSLSDYGDKIRPIWNDFADVNSTAYQEVVYELKARGQGACRYARPDQELDGANELRIYTSNGRDILRVPMQLKNSIAWMYHQVKSYGLTSLEVKDSSARVLGYFDHGSPRVQIGWANDVAFEVGAKGTAE